jgi:hypothetical protein
MRRLICKGQETLNIAANLRRPITGMFVTARNMPSVKDFSSWNEESGA